MEQLILILGYSAYEFTDDKEKVRKGGKISYITANKIDDDLKQGFLPIQTPLNFDICVQLPVPCLANIKYIASTDSSNKLVMKIGSIDVVKADVDFSSFFKINK